MTINRSRIWDLQNTSSTTEVGGGVPTLIYDDSEGKAERAVEIDSTTTTTSSTAASSSASNKTTSILDFTSEKIEEVKEWINEQADVVNDYAAEKIVSRGHGLKILILDKGTPWLLVPTARREARIVKTQEHLFHGSAFQLT